MAEEGGAVVVVEEDQEERHDGDEGNEDGGVEECALKLLRRRVGGVLRVDEVSGGADRGVRGG